MKRVEHVVMGNNSVRCLNCGAEEILEFPMAINLMGYILEGFGRDHAECEKEPASDSRFKYTTVDEWCSSWDTGVSSLTIYDAFTGKRRSESLPDVPYDMADFGRCYRLLKLVPEWRRNLKKVSDKYPVWAPFVDEWGSLENIYENRVFTEDTRRHMFSDRIRKVLEEVDKRRLGNP